MQIWGADVKDADLCGANFDVKRIEELSVMKKNLWPEGFYPALYGAVKVKA